MEFRLKATIGALLVAALFVGAIAAPELRAFAAAVIGSADIIDESILSVDIKNGEVKNSDLATDAVTGAKIKNLSIKTSDLGDSIVTSGKIKDGTIQRHDIASGVLPRGATSVIYGTCYINIRADAGGFSYGWCNVPGVVIGDAVVGNIAGLGDPGSYDVKLESLTTQTRDCDPCVDNFIYWIIKNDGDEAIDITTVLQYIVFNNSINVDG